MALIQRKIEMTFTLGEGAFGETGSNNVTLGGLRVQASIIKAGGPSMGTANLRVYGMTLSLMNQLSTLGMAPTLIRRNAVTVTAGDNQAGMGVVFQGTITNAFADMNSPPENPFVVEAHTGLIESVVPIPVSSFQGSADVATIMQGLATQMGLAFENNGVQVRLSNPYFAGSAREQAKACAEAAGIEWIIDNLRLAIWPAGGSRRGIVPLIKAPAMRGYPAYTSKGIALQTLFNPSVGFGSKVIVESDLKPACGEWIVYSLRHDLDSQVPGGKWFSALEAARPGFVVVA